MDRLYSISQIQAYLGCPLKYRFQYVNGHRILPTPGHRNLPTLGDQLTASVAAWTRPDLSLSLRR